MLSYPVKLVAVSGREQPVVLKIRRDGLWLYTEHGKEIQQLPYQHIVKWLPSKMRSRDPGPDDCLDVQVETASGKKDLRMRCQSEPTVHSIIADIRNTVQAIMSELDPAKRQGSPSKQRPAGAEIAASKAAADKSPSGRSVSPPRGAGAKQQQQQQQQGTSPPASKIPGPPAAAAESQHSQSSPPKRSTSPNRSRSQKQQQQAVDDQQRQHLETYQQDLHQQQRQQLQQRQQQQQGNLKGADHANQRTQYLLEPETADSGTPGDFAETSAAHRHVAANRTAGSSSPRQRPAKQSSQQATGATGGVADVQESEQDMLQGGHQVDSRPSLGPGAPMRRSTGELAEFAGETAAQMQFLEEMVRRLSEELACRMSADPAAAQSIAGAVALGGGVEPALPPWMKDSRYLNPLLSAYDQRLSAALAELTSKTEAINDIQDKVHALIEENESLHDQLQQQAAQLEVKASDTAAAAAANDAEKARLQERLDLLEQENDLLVGQQGDLDAELERLGGLLQQKDLELLEARTSAAASTSLRAQLEQAVKESNKTANDNQQLKDKVKSLSERLTAEAAKTAEAIGAAEALRQQQQVLQQELSAAQATSRTLPGLQADLSSARAAAASSSSEVERLRSDGERLRDALHSVEQRLVEYQQKDTEVYLRIKEAMELAEEARLERDAARTETDSLKLQLAATQAKLQEATRQLSGGGADGPSYKELKTQLSTTKEQLSAATAREQQLSTQVSELKVTVDRLTRDKSSVVSELHAVKEELELNSFRGKGAEFAERLEDAERARDEAVQKLDSTKRAATRAEREWELERQQMQGDIQHLIKKAAAAEEATSAAQAATAEAQQAVAAVEAELNSLKAGRSRVEAELRQQLQDLRSERDAEVAALVQKLERALATCDKSVVDAEQMLAAKDSLLRRWKQEAQLIASKLEVALQQHQAELADRQAQVTALTQQLVLAHEQQELLQQELDAARLSCQEAELLLGEAEHRAAAANATAADQQDDIMQELRMLQAQLERTQLEKLRAERSRDGANSKLGRMMMVGVGSASAVGSLRAGSPAGSPAKSTGSFVRRSAGDIPAGAFSKPSVSAPVSPTRLVDNVNSPVGTTPMQVAGSSSVNNSPRLLPGVKAVAAGHGGGFANASRRLGELQRELQQKDQQYNVHTGSSELL